jgi:hypothetical protein
VTAAPAPKEKPGDAAKRHITEILDRQWGLAYRELLPQQQAAFSVAMFGNCYDQKGAIPEVTGIDVVKVYQETTPTPGAGDLASTAVTVTLTERGGARETTTIHLYAVDGAWRFAVDQQTYDALTKGQPCS